MLYASIILPNESGYCFSMACTTPEAPTSITSLGLTVGARRCSCEANWFCKTFSAIVRKMEAERVCKKMIIDVERARSGPSKSA